MSLFNLSSMSGGILFSGVIIICLSFNSILRFKKNAVFVFLCILFVLLINTFLLLIFHGLVSYERYIISVFFAFFVLIVAFSISQLCFRVDEIFFNKLICNMYFCFLVISFFSIISLYFFGNEKKSMFLFIEPSHFAIAFSPFFIYRVIKSSNKFYHLLICLAMALLLKNLTLMIVFIFGVGVLLNSIKKVSHGIFLFATIVIVFYYNIPSDYFDYFIERLRFTGDLDNLSVLVFLSGYERAFLGLFDSLFIGHGFQQMGTVATIGNYHSLLILYGSGGLNKFDGGHLFSKLVFEFGFIGIVFIFYYIKKFINVYVEIVNSNDLDSRYLFSLVCLYSFFISIFVRGTGYFSVSSLLFFISIFYLYSQRNRLL
jgi:hypothetical protein